MNNKVALALALVVVFATSTSCAPADETRREKRALSWRSVPGIIACGGQAKTNTEIATTIVGKLREVSEKYQYVVTVLDPTDSGFAYSARGGVWETLEKKNICGWHVLVFRRPNKFCSYSLDNKLTQLQRSSASNSNTYTGVRDIMKTNDEDYGLAYDLIITFRHASVRWYIDSNCENFYDAGSKMSSFVVANAVA